jgi:hypothetical protein
MKKTSTLLDPGWVLLGVHPFERVLDIGWRKVCIGQSQVIRPEKWRHHRSSITGINHGSEHAFKRFQGSPLLTGRRRDDLLQSIGVDTVSGYPCNILGKSVKALFVDSPESMN